MKKHISLSQQLTNDLQTILSSEVFDSLKQRFMFEQKQLEMMGKCLSNEKINTPSTVDTKFNNKGSAIVKSRRPASSRGPKTLTCGFNVSKKDN
jgi:hypothetical protein